MITNQDRGSSGSSQTQAKRHTRAQPAEGVVNHARSRLCSMAAHGDAWQHSEHSMQEQSRGAKRGTQHRGEAEIKITHACKQKSDSNDAGQVEQDDLASSSSATGEYLWYHPLSPSSPSQT